MKTPETFSIFSKLRAIALLNSFTKMTWDGEELTGYTDGGESFCRQEFSPGSATAVLWEALEKELESSYSGETYSYDLNLTELKAGL